VVLQPWPP